MRPFPTFFSAVLAASLLISIQDRAQAHEIEVARARARQDLAVAKLDLRHYLQVEYPRERRNLNAAIKLAQAEMASLRRRERRDSLFNSYKSTWSHDPFDDERLCILQAELRYHDLLAERKALALAYSTYWRMLELNVQQARLRVAALEANAAGYRGTSPNTPN